MLLNFNKMMMFIAAEYLIDFDFRTSDCALSLAYFRVGFWHACFPSSGISIPTSPSGG